MTKTQKYELVESLTQRLNANKRFFIIDIGGFNVEKTNAFRRKCFEAGVRVQMVKNTLIRKALERVEGDFSPIYPVLKENSCLVFINEDFKTPAKLIKDFREGEDRPRIKAAYIENTALAGTDLVEEVLALKSKNEVLGEVVGMLQSPIRNVVGALSGAGQKLAGILKTLSEREQQ
ncbi:MAG: 50S ribosomal protein L10 [Bacteroidia bacterium]|nr:50S ribosomal protein L10 [Bacteroidia bacterium]